MDSNGTDSDTLVPKSLRVGRSDVGLGCTCFVVSAAAKLRGGGLGIALFQFLDQQRSLLLPVVAVGCRVRLCS